MKNNKIVISSQVANCGLFGLSEDHKSSYQSLDEFFIKKTHSTFFFKAKGYSMEPLIMSDDVLIVDRSKEVKSGQVIVASIEGEFMCKQYIKDDDQIILRSINPRCEDIIARDFQDYILFGAVTGLARKFNTNDYSC